MTTLFEPAFAKINLTLEKIVEVEGITVTDDEIEAEFKALSEKHELEIEKVKEMVPVDEIKTSLTTRKATEIIVSNAVAVAPKAE